MEKERKHKSFIVVVLPGKEERQAKVRESNGLKGTSTLTKHNFKSEQIMVLIKLIWIFLKENVCIRRKRILESLIFTFNKEVPPS